MSSIPKWDLRMTNNRSWLTMSKAALGSKATNAVISWDSIPINISSTNFKSKVSVEKCFGNYSDIGAENFGCLDGLEFV